MDAPETADELPSYRGGRCPRHGVYPARDCDYCVIDDLQVRLATADAHTAAAEEHIIRQNGVIVGLGKALVDADARTAKWKADAERLDEGGWHYWDCPRARLTRAECTCGRDEAHRQHLALVAEDAAER